MENIAYAGFLAALLLIMFGFCLFDRRREKRLAKELMAYRLNMAESVVYYALSKFYDLDRNGDGLLTVADLMAAEREEVDDAALIAHMRDSISVIGHVIGSRLVAPPMVVNVMAGQPMPILIPEIRVDIYGISRDDLQTYEPRLKARAAQA